MQRQGRRAMVSPCTSSSRQMAHSPASLDRTSSRRQTHHTTDFFFKAIQAANRSFSLQRYLRILINKKIPTVCLITNFCVVTHKDVFVCTCCPKSSSRWFHFICFYSYSEYFLRRFTALKSLFYCIYHYLVIKVGFNIFQNQRVGVVQHTEKRVKKGWKNTKEHLQDEFI